MNMLTTNPNSRPSAAIVHSAMVRMTKQESDALFVTCKLSEARKFPITVVKRVMHSAGCRCFDPFPAITCNNEAHDISLQFDQSVEQEKVVAFAKIIANEEFIDYVRHNGVAHVGSDNIDDESSTP